RERPRNRAMKKDIPFFAAFLLALLLHLLAGVGLRYSRLFAAAPALPAQEPPVTLRFVEVPPNAMSLPQPMNAGHVSDASRKAGPLVASPKRPEIPQPYTRAPGAPGAPRQAAQRGSTATASANRLQQPMEPPPPGPGASISAPAGQRLSQSLENLDQFIQAGSGKHSGGGGGDGDEPTGDPGSGVFFDTQGFDLGPWGNQAVSIVRSNWIIPVAAELGIKGVVGISFKVERNGTIRDLKIISPSGVPSFDQAALSALQSSSPLPPLPQNFPRDVLPGIFRFYYNTPVPRS
ncbi:MAG TPA: energy transducer TonB, partial [Acidobacteriota bacterium]|nr:energy transducer TonB [Acidobacteriota bacterium]